MVILIYKLLLVSGLCFELGLSHLVIGLNIYLWVVSWIFGICIDKLKFHHKQTVNVVLGALWELKTWRMARKISLVQWALVSVLTSPFLCLFDFLNKLGGICAGDWGKLNNVSYLRWAMHFVSISMILFAWLIEWNSRILIMIICKLLTFLILTYFPCSNHPLAVFQWY